MRSRGKSGALRSEAANASIVSFFVSFLAARGVLSACAFASQMVVAIRLGQRDYVLYAAACAVILLSTEAQTLAGNLEVLAKKHAGVDLSAVLSNRVYFNLLIVAPSLFITRKYWAADLGSRGIWFAITAVVLSAYFPGAYGREGSLQWGLRLEACASAVFLSARMFLPAALDVFWTLFCAEMISRAAIGVVFAAREGHVSSRIIRACAVTAFPYGVVLMCQMLFQRMEIAMLPSVSLPKAVVLVWAAGSNVLFAINAVIYQAMIGYRIVGDGKFQRKKIRVLVFASAALSFLVLAISFGIAAQKHIGQGTNVGFIVLLATYFFVVGFENFVYMDFFFSVKINEMLILSVSRVTVAGLFAVAVTLGLNGVACLCVLLVGKCVAAIGELTYSSRKQMNEHLEVAFPDAATVPAANS